MENVVSRVNLAVFSPARHLASISKVPPFLSKAASPKFLIYAPIKAETVERIATTPSRQGLIARVEPVAWGIE
jgi:hypothetical protein